MLFPKVYSKEELQRLVKNINAYKNDLLDDLTLEAVSVAINDDLDALKKEIDFLDNTVATQREFISDGDRRIKELEKEVLFYKEIISFFMTR